MKHKLSIFLSIALLWASAAFGYSGSGSIWAQPKGYYTLVFFDGDSTGFGRARDLCIKRGGGLITLGPGTENVVTTYPSSSGLLVIKQWITGLTVDPLNSGTSTSNITSVKTYGAVGDGITDDTNSVLAAITATATGNRLYFPTGTYKLSTWTVQTINKVFSVIGDGIGNSIIKGTIGNSFFSCTKDIEVSGLTFDTWGTVFDFSSVSTILENVYIHDIEVKNYNRGLYASSATVGIGISNLKIFHNKFKSGLQYPIYFSLAKLEEVQIINNKSQGSTQRGINLGNNTEAFANDRGLYTITGNTIDSVTAIQPNSSLGIAVYGWRAIIEGNTIRNVYKTSDSLTVDLDATDANGIYTKCRFTTIAHNVIVDGGQSEAFINVKGIARDETATTSPKGYGVVVDGNILIDTGTTGRLTKAVKMACSEVKVVNNYIEGHTDVGVYTDSDGAHDYLVENNFFKNIRGNSAITIFGKGKRIRLLYNTIDSVANSYNPAAQNSGIKIQKSGGGDVDIVGNHINSIRDTGTTPVGILIKPSVVISPMRVADNHIEGATYGIQFSSNAPDSVIVRDNYGRNILTNMLQYTVTPTHLTDASVIDTDVLNFNGANVGEMVNSTNPQTLRVYNTFTDASNYERIAIQANSSNSRIAVQNAGTGVARALEFETGGVQSWRITTGGTFTPMTDNAYDIGTKTTFRVRDLFMSKRIYLDYTNTATIGAVTISKPSGRFNIGTGQTSVVVTNTLVTAASHILVVASQNDATGRVVNVVPAAGSFTVNCIAPTADMSIDFVLINSD